MASSQAPPTLYMPIVPPPTPAPSPPPGQLSFHSFDPTVVAHSSAFATLSPAARRQHLHALIQVCTPSELLFLSTTIAPLLKRDFLRALPPEVSLHILSFIDDPRTLARAARVSRYWNELIQDDCLWKAMCVRHGFSRDADAVESYRREQGLDGRRRSSLAWSGTPQPDADRDQPARAEIDGFPYRKFFIHEHLRTSNWLQRGRLLRIHRAPLHPPVTQDPNAPNGAQPAIPTSGVVVGRMQRAGRRRARSARMYVAREYILSAAALSSLVCAYTRPARSQQHILQIDHLTLSTSQGHIPPASVLWEGAPP